MKNPKLFLAIDNCFAFKRWTTPGEWSKVIKELGVNYVEASADNELDPLYMGEEYLKTWILDVKKAEKEYDIKVANLYSGHGTYTTCGLTHTDAGVRRRIIERWFKPLIRTAGELGAGMGFYAHAFNEAVLEDKNTYDKYMEILYDALRELNVYAKSVGCGKLGIEQMYSPHQVPWRIHGTRNLLREVTSGSGHDFYFTEDVGHHHIKFIKPSEQDINTAIKAKTSRGIWLGGKRAYKIFDEILAGASEISKLIDEIDKNEHMFSLAEDASCYEWLEQIGCYSPIIHLQQTRGNSSAHLHFTEENNANGIITGEKLISAIAKSYEEEQTQGMPAKTDEIYLTIEAFTGTASINKETLEDYKCSVDYWRRFIFKDGLTLDNYTNSNFS